ncbi:thaumatin-like protein 1 [Tanacetum coccineum]
MEFQQLAYALLLAINLIHGVHSTVFTIRNNCQHSIAPATLTSRGAAASTTGFELASGASNDINIPTPWSGRVWARYECSNDGGTFHCNSGDCGSGQVACNGAGGATPTTLAEFTIGDSGKDTYDVSLVDGFNLPVSIVPNGGCETADCPVDINAQCPSQFAVPNGSGATIGCKSACVQFGTPEYCCTGDHSTPSTCPPTTYSMFFKNLCPRAYSYAYDDPSSLFNCATGANYDITFCP